MKLINTVDTIVHMLQTHPVPYVFFKVTFTETVQSISKANNAGKQQIAFWLQLFQSVPCWILPSIRFTSVSTRKIRALRHRLVVSARLCCRSRRSRVRWALMRSWSQPPTLARSSFKIRCQWRDASVPSVRDTRTLTPTGFRAWRPSSDSSLK